MYPDQPTLSSGWLLVHHHHLFPNRTIPEPQIDSRGEGWPNSASDAWALEFQVWLPPDSQLTFQITADADVDSNPPDSLYTFSLKAEGTLYFTRDDRSGVSGHYGTVSASNVVESR
jgi:hypothetical protein